ncbi:ATP-binding protein [Flavilitoribacter nigricans]|uniref:AAA family ATPase n=1 Tax=Flavilitoribacter nigricans (strain ATCC 23147 / DSM 23189 / NBRC 102662 / NCIMB 1420 / SS-2) TaxID=1122177 RepID=A0A2D0N0L1_FLAN2|nr:ATP-binding protein [Flavilitoribacter nigricans]PHN01253.1 AAA family ATPase [Flavilitoribacter nigricans DSM 23189 = NBRC 102662]
MEVNITKRIVEDKFSALRQHEYDWDDAITDCLREHLTDTKKKKLSNWEFFLIKLALIPHIYPHFFDELLPQMGNHPQIGGLRGKKHRGFLPTGETALFLLAGDDLYQRFKAQQLFDPDHYFAKNRILWLAPPEKNEPRMSGQLILNPKYVELFTTGKAYKPDFSLNFPAEELHTNLDWADLVLTRDTVVQLDEIKAWLQHRAVIMQDWGMHRLLKPGYRALFHGPPGTGKTLTASILGKIISQHVFRIDLSMIVSKYIGETEKNLANLFAEAEQTNWILFFDEADALFGKRTDVRDAHDKYANQEVAYLLQRIEHYDGLVILASNFKSNIDEAFLRRFQSIIYFPKPGSGERLMLWQNSFPKQVSLAKDIDLPQIAQKYELSGSEIVNVVQFCCLRAADKDHPLVESIDILDGISKEYRKYSKKILH